MDAGEASRRRADSSDSCPDIRGQTHVPQLKMILRAESAGRHAQSPGDRQWTRLDPTATEATHLQLTEDVVVRLRGVRIPPDGALDDRQP